MTATTPEADKALTLARKALVVIIASSVSIGVSVGMLLPVPIAAAFGLAAAVFAAVTYWDLR